MTFIGLARDSHDVDGALMLAAQTFRSKEGVTEKTLEMKKLLMSPHGTLSKNDIVVISNGVGEICGACFLVDRELFRGKEILKGTFLTSICIAESSRGKGLSKLLMNEAIHECERRDSAFAILIARRAVDHFYNQFSFWGLSQYSKLKLSLSKSHSTNLDCNIKSVTVEDLAGIGSIYNYTYNSLYGSFVRTTDYWKYVLWKTESQQLNFIIFKTKDKILGYSISSGKEIYELAASPNIHLLDLLGLLQVRHSLGELTLHLSMRHPIVQELKEIDFTIIKRQCNYGGHMVRVIDPNVLINCLKTEIDDERFRLGINEYLERFNGTLIEVLAGKLNVTISGSPYDFWNTCLLFGAEALSTSLKTPTLFKSQSFNINLLDQI